MEKLSMLASDLDRAAVRARIKVWTMNDCDWVAAGTLEEAREYYKEITGMDHDECNFDDGSEEPISDEAMDKMKFHDEGLPEPITFRQQLDRLLAQGQQFPMFFASTEY